MKGRGVKWQWKSIDGRVEDRRKGAKVRLGVLKGGGEALKCDEEALKDDVKACKGSKEALKGNADV